MHHPLHRRQDLKRHGLGEHGPRRGHIRLVVGLFQLHGLQPLDVLGPAFDPAQAVRIGVVEVRGDDEEAAFLFGQHVVVGGLEVLEELGVLGPRDPHFYGQDELDRLVEGDGIVVPVEVGHDDC